MKRNQFMSAAALAIVACVSCAFGQGATQSAESGQAMSKAGTAADWPLRRSWAINGPTTGDVPPGGSLPPFAWAAFNSTSHEGLPPVYDFAYEAMVPDSEVWPISA